MATIQVIIGNIFDSDAEVLAHQVNCLGLMGAGLALQIRRRHPDVYKAYRNFCRREHPNEPNLLGSMQLVPIPNGRYIANCFGQQNIGKGIQTNYWALAQALSSLATVAGSRGFKKVAIPFGIGCGLAGGKWAVVLDIIRTSFARYSGTVEIYRLPPEEEKGNK